MPVFCSLARPRALHPPSAPRTASATRPHSHHVPSSPSPRAAQASLPRADARVPPQPPRPSSSSTGGPSTASASPGVSSTSTCKVKLRFGPPPADAAVLRSLRLAALASVKKPPPPPRPGPSIPEPDFYSKLSPAQVASELHEDALFLDSISQQDRVVFLSGHRLSREARDRLLNRLSPEVREKWGLRFSDEPTGEDSVDPTLESERLRREKSHPRPFKIRVQSLLRDLWHYAHPLLLELAADAHLNGINLAFNARDDLGQPGPVSMALDPAMLAALLGELRNDFGDGLSIGFFADPPFGRYLSIPTGLVPKSDDRWRVIKDYTRGLLNKRADKASFSYLKWTLQDQRFLEAGKGSWTVGWDAKSAYPQLAIRRQDRCLTCSHIPGHGWYYRTSADFGSSTASYRWEGCGGRLLGSLYLAMSHRVHVSGAGITSVPPVPIRHYQCLADPSVYQDGFADLDTGAHHFITNEGRRRLSLERKLLPPTGVDLDGASIWVDDGVKSFKTANSGMKAFCALIYLHARYGSPLEPSKLTFGQLFKFGGIWHDSRTMTKALDPEKLLALRALLEPLLQGKKVSARHFRKVLGLMNFCVRALPALAGLLSGLFAASSTASAIAASSVNSATADTPTTSAKSLALREAKVWDRACALAPAVSAAFVRWPWTSQALERAQVIFHVDWSPPSQVQNPARGEHTVSAVSLSLGLWAHMTPPRCLTDRAVGPANGDSSPALEALNIPFLLWTFRRELKGRTVLILNDNGPCVQAFQRPSHGTGALAETVAAAAVLQVCVDCLIHVSFVGTKQNLSDPVSRHLFQVFQDRMSSLTLSVKPSPSCPSFPDPRRFWTEW